MLNLARRLFWRYADQRNAIRRSVRPLRDASGRLLADEAEISLSDGRVRVRVRVPAAAAATPLHLLDATGFATPMAEETDAAGRRWLTASVPEHWGALRLEAGEAEPVPLPVPGRSARLAALALLPGFVLRLMGVLPRTWRWLRDGDPMLRLAVLDALGLSGEPTPLLDGRLFGGRDPAGRVRLPDNITIVLPVHNALELLTVAVDRIEANTDLPWHLIAIEDRSTDARVRPWLRERLSRLPPEQVTLIENEVNLGFVGSVNLGFARALRGGSGPVVLLNSDAFVPPGWASRLVAPLMADAAVASVTPMSNDAELMTVPVIGAPRRLMPGEGDALDRVAAGLAPGIGRAEVPTGVGFCMAISRAWLERVPRFDPAFGRGYGEEVDWCQTVLALGGRHVALPGLFVEHHGGGSFGSAAKSEALVRARALLTQRHPRFPERVEAFVRADPLVTPRLALAVAWAAGRRAGALPVYVAHSLGGGAEIWLQERIARHLEGEGEGSAVVLRLGGVHRWRLELCIEGAPVSAGMTDDIAAVAAILHRAPQLAFCYSCSVGDPDPAALPGILLDLVRPQDRLEVCFHDFYPISPSYTLLDSSDRFRGVPAPDDPDPAHEARRRDGTRVSLRAWRAAWGRLAARADRLVVFSDDSAAHVAAAWPELAGSIAVEPHVPHTQLAPVPPPPPGAGFAVAVLGNIGRHKGILLLAEVAGRLEAIPGAPRIVVIGRTDPAHPLPDSVQVHGAYALDELGILCRRYAIGAWLIPSIWPETFSYATHEALATGLPVIGLGLGAQGDAIARHGNGIVVPHGDPGAMAQGIVDAILWLGRRREAPDRADEAARALPGGRTGA